VSWHARRQLESIMNLQSIVVVLLRLMALHLVLLVIQMIPMWLVLWPELLVQNSDERWLYFCLLVFVMFILLASAALLWVRALPLAHLVIRPVLLEGSLGSLSLADCYSIAFIGLGLYQMVVNLAGVLTFLHLMYAATNSVADWMEPDKLSHVFTSFVPFVIGLILFIKGRAWALKLAARQQAVEPPPPTGEA
jgi:hypothetical protein